MRGTDVAIQIAGSLRRLMVLSYGAIMRSAEKARGLKDCRLPLTALGLTPRAVDGNRKPAQNRVRTLSYGNGASA